MKLPEDKDPEAVVSTERAPPAAAPEARDASPETTEAPEPNPAPPAADPAPARWNPPAKSRLIKTAIIALVAGSASAALYAWQLPPFAGRFEQTDDANVRGLTTVISPQVSGYVSEVAVQDFEDVQAGQVLIRIEDQVYYAKVAQTEANVGTQIANLHNSTQAQRSKEANELAQDASIANARAQLVRAQADMRRIDALTTGGWVTAKDRDQQVATLHAAEAQLREANAAREIGRQDVRTVIVGREGLAANVDAAEAQVRLARIDLGHTIIRAPEAGQLSEVGVRRGQYVTAGTQLMFLVPDNLWITANYREVQTRKMRVGQPVTFTVDALGHAKLTGHIQNMAPAAGSEFAVLKPDNATGNFVKVAQRIAVKIRIDPAQPLAKRLRPGMSVVTRVDTRG